MAGLSTDDAARSSAANSRALGSRFPLTCAARSLDRDGARMSARQPREWPIAPTRRAFLRLACGAAGLVAAPALVGCVAGSGANWRQGDPFSLGVASGDPAPDGFVLWTRLAPDPLSGDPATPGGMSGPDVALTYEIANDV